MKRDLADPELFGNEAGEDETPEVLNSYFVDKPEFIRFFSEQQRLCFVRARARAWGNRLPFAKHCFVAKRRTSANFFSM